MLRIAALAASAAVLVAAPAYAASVHVSTAGKSAAEVKADVVKAAAHVCYKETYGSVVGDQLQAACVRATVRSALAGSNDPALVTVASR